MPVLSKLIEQNSNYLQWPKSTSLLSDFSHPSKLIPTSHLLTLEWTVFCFQKSQAPFHFSPLHCHMTSSFPCLLKCLLFTEAFIDHLI